MSSKKRAYSKLCEQQFFLEYHYWEMRKMTTFLIGLAILIIGGFLYGSFVERIFKPDDRQTPAVKLEDGVDYVPMSKWKNALGWRYISKWRIGGHRFICTEKARRYIQRRQSREHEVPIKWKTSCL